VPDGSDYYPRPLEAIENDIRRTANDQFAHTRAGAGASQAGMALERFHHCHNPGGQTFGCFRLVQSHIGANFPETLERQRRPDNLRFSPILWLVPPGR